MDESHRKRLVETYIERFTRTFKADADGIIREHKGATDNNSWAFEELDEICDRDPSLALDVVLDILRTPHVDSVTEILAAGAATSRPSKPAQAVVVGDPYVALWPQVSAVSSHDSGLYFISTRQWSDEETIESILQVPEAIAQPEILSCEL